MYIIIQCNCQIGCSTLRCTFKKHDFKCFVVCGHCKGSGCMNSNTHANEDGSDDDNPDADSHGN